MRMVFCFFFPEGGGDINVLKLIMVIIAQFYEYIKSYLIAQFKGVNCMTH